MPCLLPPLRAALLSAFVLRSRPPNRPTGPAIRRATARLLDEARFLCPPGTADPEAVLWGAYRRLRRVARMDRRARLDPAPAVLPGELAVAAGRPRGSSPTVSSESGCTILCTTGVSPRLPLLAASACRAPAS